MKEDDLCAHGARIVLCEVNAAEHSAAQDDICVCSGNLRVTAEPRGHEAVEHTADVGLRIWGPSLEDVFAEAAIGVIGVMGTANGARVSETVALEAADLEALFVDWLSEVLFLFEARKVAPEDVRVRIDRERFTLDATIEGTRAETFVQEGPAVKAVTFHGLELDDTHALVYLDV